MSDKIPTIQCPLDCIASFGEVFNNQYDHPGVDQVLRNNAVYNPVILDIGANVGAFALWASIRWPRASIDSYEPNPEIYAFLESNVSHLEKVSPRNRAVGDPDRTKLKAGRNRLCTTIVKETGEEICDIITEIPVTPPEVLWKSNIVKLDCEGSEGYICEHLQFVPEYLVLEFHSEELRLRCEKAMEGKMTLVECTVAQPGLGMLKFLRL